MAAAGSSEKEKRAASIIKLNGHGAIAIFFAIALVHRTSTAKIGCIDREGIAILIGPFTYDRETHIVSGRKGNIEVENLSPQLSEEERLEQRKCIEAGLFEVFIQYAKPSI